MSNVHRLLDAKYRVSTKGIDAFHASQSLAILKGLPKSKLPTSNVQCLMSNSLLFTLNSSLFTLNSSLFTLHSSLFTLHSSLVLLNKFLNRNHITRISWPNHHGYSKKPTIGIISDIINGNITFLSKTPSLSSWIAPRGVYRLGFI